MTIYELTDAMIGLEEEAKTGGLDDEIYQDTFEGLEGAFEDKCESWAKWIRQNETSSEGIESEIKRLTKLKKIPLSAASKKFVSAIMADVKRRDEESDLMEE